MAETTFGSWTPEKAEEFNRQQEAKKGTFAKRLAEMERGSERSVEVQNTMVPNSITKAGPPIKSIAQAKATITADFRVRPSTDEEKLNKLETAFLAYLRALNPPYLGIQNITLKLADDCRLTVDFVYLDASGKLWFVDVKGPHQWEDSLIKIKVAARLYPWAYFCMAKREEGQWKIYPIKT